MTLHKHWTNSVLATAAAHLIPTPPAAQMRLWVMDYPSTQVLVFGPYDREGAISHLMSAGWEYDDSLAKQLTEVTGPAVFEREVNLEDAAQPAETPKPPDGQFLVNILIDDAGGYEERFRKDMTYWAKQEGGDIGYDVWDGNSWFYFSGEEILTHLQRLD